MAADLEKALPAGHRESWWQTYIRSKILLIQQGYIKAIEKMNIAIGNTKFPDFSLVTYDNYLDILEIKKLSTDIFKFDKSRGNYFFDPENSKAVVQRFLRARRFCLSTTRVAATKWWWAVHMTPSVM